MASERPARAAPAAPAEKARLFFALWPPEETAGALHAWAGRAQRRCGGRVTRAEAIHLTLAFLGEVARERIAHAIAAAKRVRGEPCTLELDHARFWPHNRIVWAGASRVPGALEALARRLRIELEGEGFALGGRPFAVHVTLLRKAHPPGRLPSLAALAWPVREFALLRSRLAAEGSAYETVARFRLDADEAGSCR